MSLNFIGQKGWSGNFANKFAETVVNWRWTILIGTILAVGLGAYGIKNLAQTNDYRVWFSKDSQDLKAFDLLESKYSKSDNVLFVIAPKDGNVFSRKTLEDIRWVTEQAWKTPFSSRVDSLTNFQKTDAKRDQLIVHDLVGNTSKLSDSDLKNIRDYSLTEPALVKNLVSSRGHVAAVSITINMPGKAATEATDVAAYVRNLKKRLAERDPNVRGYLIGVIMLEVVDSEISNRDLQTLVPLMYVILLIGLGILLRTVLGVFVTLLTLTFTILASMGLSGWLGYPVTAISGIIPSIIMTLAVSDCVHVLVTYYQQLRHGKEKRDAMISAIKFNLYPSTLTSVANLIGYASMNFSESPPFRQFGTTVAIGSALEVVLAFLFIPALMLILPWGVKTSAEALSSDGEVRPSRMEEGMASLVLRNRFRFLAALTAITIVFGLCVLKNERNEEYTKYHAKRIDLRQDSDFVAANLTGIMDIEYSLDAKEASGIYRPEFLHQVEKFTNWYRTQPEVESVDSITDVVKRINRSMHGDDQKWYRVPEDRKTLAQYLLLYEMSLPYGMDLTTFFNLDKSGTKMVVRVKKITTNELIALDHRAKDWARNNTELFKNDNSYGSSVSMLFALINDRMIYAMIEGFIVSFILISVLLMILFRSVKMGLISVIPNIFPAVIAFGIWGITNGRIGMAVGMVCSTTLGIVVDSTIHLFYHYLAGRREFALSPEQSVHHAFKRAGTAIVVTDTILVIGFGTLILSPFELNWVMGEMTAMTIFFDIFVTLFLTVPFLLLFDRSNNNGSGGSFLERLTNEVSVLKNKVLQPFRQTGFGVFFLLALSSLLVLTPRVAQSNETSEAKGLEIARKAKKVESGYHDYSADLKMVLFDAGGSSAAPDLLRLSFIETPGDGDKSMAIFDAPGDIKGTSLLTYSHRSAEDDQWLFLPAVKRVKRISSTNKSGPFMGSEFAYEDTSYQAVERYHYHFVKQDRCSLGTCFVVERTPVDSNSGYSKQLVWWDTKEYRLAKIEYFDRKGSPLKTLEDSQFKKFLSHIWHPLHMVMTNLQTGRKTVVEWSGFRFHQGLTSRDFDTNSLQRSR